ncbi:DUF4935 domain-containing protein [Serratia plymuthica]|uniref:PIN-like domain-containing protein n=1 Tax=Serratia plymuthica TaxID=82996 RepID=UPI0019269573|nr:PIN-like domain-containing protein [Serratia plymuthica]MBL3524114.1 DUF4935 domain-containing protein [Serratia plymuthica]
MRNIFESRYNKDANYYNDLLSNSTYILDTNVLLSLYRYSESTRGYFLDALERVKDKLWMPNQVGNEFFTNRLAIISEQIKSYTAFKKEFEELQRKLDNKKSHPFIRDETSNTLNSALNEVYSDLRVSQEKYECLINDDIVLSKLLNLYENRVGTPYSEEEINTLINEGRERYSKQIPPGYMDFAKNGSGKNDENLFGYNRIRPYGDFIIWRQSIDYAKDKTNIIIVTDDIKEDWYVRALGKTIGPRHELLAEFKELTGQNLHVYQSDMFLERITNLLGIAKNQGAVDEIKASNLKIELMHTSIDHNTKLSDIENNEISKEGSSWIHEILKLNKEHYDDVHSLPESWKGLLYKLGVDKNNDNDKINRLTMLQDRLAEVNKERLELSLLQEKIEEDITLSDREKTIEINLINRKKASVIKKIIHIQRLISDLNL